MSKQGENQAFFLAKLLFDKGNPIGRIIATIVLLFFPPVGWFCAAVLWGIYFLNKNDGGGD